jgi:Spy/CpxP family protein refolding chaperone
MISQTKTAMLVYLAATFFLGGIAGGAVGYRYGRQPIFRPPNPVSMLQHQKERYSRELELTAEQQKQLEPLLQQNMDEWEQSHHDRMKQVQALVKQSRERIETILTETQKTKFRESERNRENAFGRGGPGGPRGPGGPPHDEHRPTPDGKSPKTEPPGSH